MSPSTLSTAFRRTKKEFATSHLNGCGMPSYRSNAAVPSSTRRTASSATLLDCGRSGVLMSRLHGKSRAAADSSPLPPLYKRLALSSGRVNCIKPITAPGDHQSTSSRGPGSPRQPCPLNNVVRSDQGTGPNLLPSEPLSTSGAFRWCGVPWAFARRQTGRVAIFGKWARSWPGGIVGLRSRNTSSSSLLPASGDRAPLRAAAAYDDGDDASIV